MEILGHKTFNSWMKAIVFISKKGVLAYNGEMERAQLNINF